MTTYKPKMTKAEMAIKAADVWHKIENGSMLYITINSVSKSGMSYKYKITLVSNLTGQIKQETLTYWLASEWNETAVSSWAGDLLKGNGCGFDRYHQAAYNLFQTLERHGLLTNALDYATSKHYEII